MKKQKLTNRKIQAINTKNKIYQVAIELMDKKGYENIKIEDVCKNAGVSVGSFYNYFNSKSDILSEIFKKADEYFENEVINNLKSSNTLEMIVEFFTYYGKYNEIVGVDTMKQLYKFNNKLFIAKGRYMQSSLKEIIISGQNKGEIVINMTANEISEYLFIVARGIAYDWCLHDGEYNMEQYIHDYFNRYIVIFKNL
jgi:AcrR family transcriptional regulator